MQQSLFARDVHAELERTEHGGSVRRGRRKLERPVSTRRPMHVVLSSQLARGPWSLRKHERAVSDALRAMARRFGVRVYDFANVGSHLHLLVRARRRNAFHGFLRSFAGIVARRVTGARRGRPSGRFFSGLVWTRIVSWGRDYLGVRHYVFRNEIEGTLGRRIRRALEAGPAPAHALQLSPSRAGPVPLAGNAPVSRVKEISPPKRHAQAAAGDLAAKATRSGRRGRSRRQGDTLGPPREMRQTNRLV